MKKIVRFLAVSLAAAIALSAGASAEDVLKVAGVHRGLWESAATELGQQAGIFKKYGIVLDLIHLDEVKEIVQSVATAKADIGVGVGTMSAIQAYAYGAPIRIIGASMAGSVNYWYVLKSSPVRSIKDIDGKTIAYERNGSSSQYDALDLMRKYDIKAKLILTGRPEATFASVNAGIVDVGGRVVRIRLAPLARREAHVVFPGLVQERVGEVCNIQLSALLDPRLQVRLDGGIHGVALAVGRWGIEDATSPVARAALAAREEDDLVLVELRRVAKLVHPIVVLDDGAARDAELVERVLDVVVVGVDDEHRGHLIAARRVVVARARRRRAVLRLFHAVAHHRRRG